MVIHKDKIWRECRRPSAELRETMEMETDPYSRNPVTLQSCPFEGTHSASLYPTERTSRREEPPNLTAIGPDHKGPPFLFHEVNV